MVLFAHALQAVQVARHLLHAMIDWSKVVINVGHFTLEAEAVFHFYPASHRSQVTEASNMVFS
jgi:hypothetical protein